MTAPPTIPTGFLSEEQRRRVQALTAATLLAPYADVPMQVNIARWVMTGRWGEA